MIRRAERMVNEKDGACGWEGFVLAMGVLLAALALAVPVVAQASAAPAVRAYTLTPGRIGAMVAGLTALAGAILGGRALARSRGPLARRAAVTALVLASIGAIIGALVVAAADGGLGTGNGLGGGVVAMAAGLIGMTLGGLALGRSRRTS